MEKLKMHSPNLTETNIDRIRELFPNCITEGKDESGKIKYAIDFDLLKQELSGQIVEGSQERYQLNWPGKKEALLTANAPIAKTLRPCIEESVDFDNTKNLFIEGDNLDALKLLQETYLGRIKLIYIDPPYNTGNDFIYEDDFAENSDDFLIRSIQKDKEGNRLVTNTESNGRFHSDWMSMMYPRLKLARNLLCDKGVIYISIDDNEVDGLKKICDEVFGKANFVATFVWRRRASSAMADRLISTDHEYVVAYQKADFSSLGQPKDFNNYLNPDNDPRGSWVAGDLTVGMGKDLRPNQFYDLVDPKTKKIYKPNPNRVWAYIPESMTILIKEGKILFPEDTNRRPMLKRFKNELKSIVNPVSTWLTDIGLNTEATKELQSLFGQSPFDYSKPTSLIKFLVKITTKEDDLIIDFFAGSGTTANSIFELNAEDGANRRFILVQIPEECKRGNFKTIADVCKERIRRSGKKVKEELEKKQLHEKDQPSLLDDPDEKPIVPHDLDIGFRVLKIDTSNMADVFYTPDALKSSGMFGAIDNIKPGRTDEDLLFQVLLDWGVDISLPIRKEKVSRKGEKGNKAKKTSNDDFEVFFVDENALVACFDDNISEGLVRELANRKPLRVVFKDNGFESDTVKINTEQIFKQLSPNTVVKSI